MESFGLLKYWRASAALANVRSTSTSTSAIVTSALVPATEKDNVAGGDEEEDGSFFDLEFSSAIAATANENSVSISESDGDEEVDEEKEKEKEKEMSLTVSDDLFFNATLVPLETSAILLSPSSDSDPKAIFPISFLKSATRFRVFTKKNRSNADTDTDTDSPKKSSNFFIRFINVEEVPIVSLFGGSRKTKPDQVVPADQEKKFLVQKYIDKIKPLYVRVSRRYGDRLGFSGQLTVEGPAEAGGGGDQTARVATGFRVVMKRLGKSKSASSSAVAAVSSPPVSIKNTDDSIVHQEDGIQSAIAHCKKSFNYSPKEGRPEEEKN